MEQGPFGTCESLMMTSKHVLFLNVKLECRAGQGDGYCVPQSMLESAPVCSPDGPSSQCASNSLCFMRDAEEESLEKWYAIHCIPDLQWRVAAILMLYRVIVVEKPNLLLVVILMS